MSWRNSMVSVIGISSIILYIVGHQSLAYDEQFKADSVAYWANTLGLQLDLRCRNASKIDDLIEYYRDPSVARYRTVVDFDGSSLVLKTAGKIQKFLKTRSQAAQKIKRKAESAYINRERNLTLADGCDSNLYYNSKTLKLYKPKPNKDRDLDLDRVDNSNATNNSTEPGPEFMPLFNEWARYYHIPVSLNSSAVHIATNVFECSAEMLGNISWSSKLDEIFIENHPSMPSTWQYFASSSGYMRYYPASKWMVDGLDMFDARITPWYTQAANFPKHVVILLDASGSMIGLRIQIAMITVKKILQTLQEDDFFIVLLVRNETVMADTCELADGTFLQGTVINKQRMISSIEEIDLSERADFGVGLSHAFELLLQVDFLRTSTNNAIMIITDGAPAEYQDVFKQYNWKEDESQTSRWVRVFTYLIGQEVSSSNAKFTKWMACDNKGYFYQIATMSDVHDYVQDYVRVMSRPLALENLNRASWSALHIDMPLPETDLTKEFLHPVSSDWIRIPSDADSPQLRLTVSMPVYDLTPEKRSEGNLLGVVGIDVLINELLDLIPRSKLGVNGYAFIINSNGFVLMHPDLSPWVEPCTDDICVVARQGNPNVKTYQPKPGYENVDLTYLEQEANPEDGQVFMLRENMINGSTGMISIQVKKLFGKKTKRVYIQTQTYHYTKIDGTPYSIALVVAEPSSAKQVIYTGQGVPSDLDSCRSEVAPWNYCDVELDKDYSELSGIELLHQVLARRETDSVFDEEFYRKRCDMEMMGALIHDAKVTKGMLASWEEEMLKVNSESVEERRCTGPFKDRCESQKEAERLSRKLKIDFVLLGTRAGLTRYQAYPEEQQISRTMTNPTTAGSCPLSGRPQPIASIDSEYYRRTAVSDKRKWIFNVGISSNINSTTDFSSVTVTASQGVYIQNSVQHEDHKDSDELLMSVLALNVDFLSLGRLFLMTSMLCHEGNAACGNFSCEAADVECYLLDDGGYVITSEYLDDVGLFFGEIDYQIMLDMADNGVYEQIHMLDYQALCTVCRTSQSSSSSLLDPLKYLSSVVWWTLSKMMLFIIEFSLKDWWYYLFYATGLRFNCFTVTAKPDNPLAGILTHRDLLQDLIYMSPCIQTRDVFLGTSVKNITSSNVTRCVTCTTQTSVGPNENRTEICTTKPNEDCSRSYHVNRVQHTNLYLLVVDATCRCGRNREPTCVVAEELYQGCSEAAFERYRKASDNHASLDQYSSTTTPKARFFNAVRNKPKDASPKQAIKELPNLDCGRSSNLKISLTLFLLSILSAL